jgi:hypothetical protein
LRPFDRIKIRAGEISRTDFLSEKKILPESREYIRKKAAIRSGFFVFTANPFPA